MQVPSHPAMPLFQAILGSNGIRVEEPSLAIGNEQSIKSIFAQAGFAGIQVTICWRPASCISMSHGLIFSV